MAARKTTRTRKAQPQRERNPATGRFVKADGPPAALMTGGASHSGGSAADMATLAEREMAAPVTELGATGLRHYVGVIDEEFLPALRGKRQIQVYTEMRDNDPTVGAVLFAIEMLMRQVRWTVEPGTTDPSDVELADFVDSCLGDMNDTWADTLASIFSFLPFGFSIHETVYKRRDGFHPEDVRRDSDYNDGRIGWRKLPVRAQDTIDRWIFHPETDEMVGLVQLPPPSFTYRTIPETKIVNFRTTSAKGNPQGRSVLRNAYRPWYFKRRIEEIEAIGVERDLAGLPSMTIPAELLDRTADASKRSLLNEIRSMLRDVRRDEREGILIPQAFDKAGNPRYKFELVRSGGRRQFDTTQIINRYDRAIASVVLADFILLGQQRVGAFSLADAKTELFAAALGAWLDATTQIFNRIAIPRLLRLNGVMRERPPKLVHGDVEQIDLRDLGDYISKLTGSGMPLFPDDALENALRAAGGLPEKPEGETRADPGGLTPEQLAALGAPADGSEPRGEAARAIGVAEGVQAQVLNGAQVAAIVGIAQSVASNEITRESAIAILGVAFGFTPGKAAEILGPALDHVAVEAEEEARRAALEEEEAEREDALEEAGLDPDDDDLDAEDD